MKHKRNSMGLLVTLALLIQACGSGDLNLQPHLAGSNNGADIVALQVSLRSLMLKGIGTSIDMTVIITLSNGQVLTGVQDRTMNPVTDEEYQVDWSTENEFVALFAGPGALTAISAGETRIHASIGDMTASADVMVEAADVLDPVDVESPIALHVANVTINPSDLVMGIGTSASLAASLFYSDGLTQDDIKRYYVHPDGELAGQLVWYSEDPSIADAVGHGFIQANAPGDVVIHVEDPWTPFFPKANIQITVR